MTGPLDPESLSRISVFRDLTPAELARMSSLLRCKVFPADTGIITVEQPGEVVYIIRSGTVKIHVEQADGSDVILAILGAGEVVGEINMFDKIGRSANVVTMEECALCWMDSASFSECVRIMPQLALNLLSVLARRLRLADEQIQSLAALDVYGRVARQLLAFAEEYGEQQSDGGILIPLRLTQSDLADLTGATRVRVNQVLVDYRERGYISTRSDHRIIVHDREALARRYQ
jgi:CRP/FNR family cyclic AMP-dependent transcriptional regulator